MKKTAVEEKWNEISVRVVSDLNGRSEDADRHGETPGFAGGLPESEKC